MGEFVAGNAVHLSAATGKQKINAGYLPFSGERHTLNKTEGRILDAALAAPSNTGYTVTCAHVVVVASSLLQTPLSVL